MSIIAFESLLIILLVVVNGVFAMSELAVVSSRKGRLQQLANAGDVGARAALELANNPDRFLSTVQIGITLVGILAGAFGGATIAEQIGFSLGGVPALAPYGEAIGLG
ncbi:MAG TPA: CNNM domain-containing protein, partial [Pyrinomonadaceae bacterium]